MNRERYVYNANTLQYEKISLPLRTRIYRVLGYSSAILFTSIILFVLAYFFLPSPKEKALQREIAQMEYYYQNLSSDIQTLTQSIDELQEKDADIHRVAFGIDPIDDAIWNGGIGGHDQFTELTIFDGSGHTIKNTLQLLDQLKRKINLQEMSLDTLQTLAILREEKLASIPSIKPVQEDKLKRRIGALSGFGLRIHPVHKVKKLHKGIDFTAPTGTPVQATGNGVIKRIEKKKRGYGINVLIDHGYGYETLYAHMQSVEVKKGQSVVKGQKIGTVGSTGTSTAPHLHYEVRLNKIAINPIDYCLDGLSTEEYKELVKKASQENKSFD